MAGTFKANIIKGSIIKDDGYMRIYLYNCRVDGISILSDALNVGLPNITDTLSIDPQAYCVSRTFTPGGGVGHFSADVELTYERLLNPVVERGTALVAEESSYDQSGALVQVHYLPVGANGSATTAKKTTSFSSFRPVTTLKARRYEVGALTSEKNTIIGSTNTDSWCGGDPGTWVVYDEQSVVRAANVNLVSGGTTVVYDSTYTFAYKSNGWRSNCFWVLPDGSIPNDIDWPTANPFSESAATSGNGWIRVQIFKPINFTSLFGTPLTT